MTATGAANEIRRLSAADVPEVARLLETGFGASPGGEAAEQHQFLLDCLDRGEFTRFSLWPAESPVGLLYVNAAGTVVPAGSAAAAPTLAAVLQRCDWRILIGGQELGQALLEATASGGLAGRSVFRRRVNARQQRFMSVRELALPAAVPRPMGLRRGEPRDLERLTELACRLHVEDQMGPPVGRAGRAAVRTRMEDAISRGLSFVVERDGLVVAKVDLSLCSRRRGAQLAGVYVDAAHRGLGIATAAVAAIAADVLGMGLPVATLHVRTGNPSARHAYARAGFADRAGWILALR